jgi:hypothetical protein
MFFLCDMPDLMIDKTLHNFSDRLQNSADDDEAYDHSKQRQE